MENEFIEIGGELASALKEAALERGVTLKELVIHLLLQFIEESEEDLDDEESSDADEDGEPENE